MLWLAVVLPALPLQLAERALAPGLPVAIVEGTAQRPLVIHCNEARAGGSRRNRRDRARVFVTNAVKHFKYEPRGKRRIHKKPSDAEIDACNVWLQQEIEAVGPQLIVALGATAIRALAGRALPVQASRGRVLTLDDGRPMLVTVHPSFLLRVPPENRDAEYAKFVDDLRVAARWLRDHGASR
jgi:DNA polymerase